MPSGVAGLLCSFMIISLAQSGVAMEVDLEEELGGISLLPARSQPVQGLTQ